MNADPRQIASTVGAAAVTMIEPLTFLPVYVAHLARDGRALGDEADEYISGTYDELREAADVLGALYDPLAGWWLANQPPAFAPQAASVVEGVLHAAARLVALLTVPGLLDLNARCLWAHRLFSLPDEAVIEAALRCEVAMMTRRPAPGSADTVLWKQVFAKDGLPKHANIKFAAQTRAAAELPTGWAGMSEEQRIEAVRNPPTERPPSRPLPDRPNWSPELNVLTCRGRVARDYRGVRSAPNQLKLLSALQAAGWPAEFVLVPGISADVLGETVRSFNKTVAPGTIRFRQSGTSVGWEWSVVRKR